MRQFRETIEKFKNKPIWKPYLNYDHNVYKGGYNAANEPKYPESLVNSIELRRLKALQVLKPKSKLLNYKKFYIDSKIVEESKNE